MWLVSGGGPGRSSTCDEKNMDSCRQDKLISCVWEEQRGFSAEKEAKKTRSQGRTSAATEKTEFHFLSQLFAASSASSQSDTAGKT